MMHMTFYWSKEVTILFSSWHTDSWLSYSLSLLACIAASIFYQYLEDRRLQLKLMATTLGAAKAGGNSSAAGAQIEEPLIQAKFVEKKWASIARIAGAVLFGINSGLGYMLMLAIMSFNGGVFIATVLGLAVGYYLFRSSGEELKIGVDNPCACA